MLTAAADSRRVHADCVAPIGLQAAAAAAAAADCRRRDWCRSDHLCRNAWYGRSRCATPSHGSDCYCCCCRLVVIVTAGVVDVSTASMHGVLRLPLRLLLELTALLIIVIIVVAAHALCGLCVRCSGAGGVAAGRSSSSSSNGGMVVALLSLPLTLLVEGLLPLLVDRRQSQQRGSPVGVLLLLHV